MEIPTCVAGPEIIEEGLRVLLIAVLSALMAVGELRGIISSLIFMTNGNPIGWSSSHRRSILEATGEVLGGKDTYNAGHGGHGDGGGGQGGGGGVGGGWAPRVESPHHPWLGVDMRIAGLDCVAVKCRFTR